MAFFWIIEITFLLFPLVGLILSRYATKYIVEFGKWGVLIFLLYDVLYFFGYSIRGDYADLIGFSVEYLCFCSIILSIKSYRIPEILKKIIRTGGVMIQIFTGLIAGLGFFAVMLISTEYESDLSFKFIEGNNNFEVRRYSIGFVTSLYTDYRFETYRDYRFLPFEKKIDETTLVDTISSINVADTDLIFSIENDGNKKLFRMRSKNGGQFIKRLE